MEIETIEKLATNISIIVGALLAIDNILDGIFKAAGYKEGDTFCGQIAELLNRAQNKLPAPTAPSQQKVD
jgi:hypothetical protein